MSISDVKNFRRDQRVDEAYRSRCSASAFPDYALPPVPVSDFPVLDSSHRRQVTPSGSASEFEHIYVIAKWCECLQGKQPLVTALRHVARVVGAKSVCLSRHSRKFVRVAQTLAFNEPELIAASLQVDRSYAHCVLGAYLDRPRMASVWLSSSADEHNDPALSLFQQAAGVAETAVVPLAVEGQQIDYLELHFAAPLDESSRSLLSMIADSLSRLWAGRSAGLFSEAVLSARTEKSVTPVQGRLLMATNPAHLSRAEFRICLLLSRGLNQRSVCDELSISSATLRAHLRSIFKKTGLVTLSELVYALLAPPISRDESLSYRVTKLA